MRIINNHGGVASGKIYNLGNPNNDLSVRELAAMMLELAAQYPEYRDAARRGCESRRPLRSTTAPAIKTSSVACPRSATSLETWGGARAAQ